LRTILYAGAVIAPFRAEERSRGAGVFRVRAVRATVRAALDYARFGAKVAEPIAYEEVDWEREEWTRGCCAAHLATGVLTQYGPCLRVPAGRIHWAGTETATISHGAIDGAIRSGQRAADEVLAIS
jgi:monoamine oxidase